MDTLMSLPMTASVLTEYGDLEEACRSCGCDGLEVVWGGEELPCTVPQALHVGYHLTFYPDWLDFWPPPCPPFSGWLSPPARRRADW